MIKLRHVALALILWSSSASAQTPAQVQALINSTINSNGVGNITGTTLNTALNQMLNVSTSFAANSLLANITGTSGFATQVLLPSCNTNGQALQYTQGSGFSCAFRNSAANTVLGNTTNSTAVAADIALPSCNSVTSFLGYSPGVGFQCNTITAGANTVKGNPTASPLQAISDIALPSCTGSTAALQWTTNVGFGCAAITTSGSAGAGITLPSGAITLDPTFHPYFLEGCTLSNDGTNPTTTLDIALCAATDSTQAIMFKGAAFTKIISTQGANPCTTSFVPGTGKCGMIAGVAANQWYFVFAIVCAGAYDVYFDTSLTGANKPACASNIRRIGAIKTGGSSNIISFGQIGDHFYWQTPVTDISSTITSVGINTSTLASVPPMTVGAIITVGVQNASVGVQVIMGIAGQNSGTAVMIPILTTQSPGLNDPQFIPLFWTNSSGQISWRLNTATSTTFTVVTGGWVDNRGQNQLP